MKQVVFLLLFLLTNACAAQPTQVPIPTAGAPYVIKQEENPYEPRMYDLTMKQDGVILTSTNLSERYDLTPIRAELHVQGSMPSVCSELRIKVNPPDNQYQINIDIYGVTNQKLNCENVFQRFDTTILLGVYSPGQFTILVNDNIVGSLASY
jgi:hypothetical protein